MALEKYWVEHVKFSKTVRKFILRWHYSFYANVQCKHAFAMFRPGKFNMPEMVGVMVYTRPAGANAAQKYYPDNPDLCLELRRLCCIDDTPKNAESFFISRTIKWLRDNTDYKMIISYADGEQGHVGTIYKAANFKIEGMTLPGKRLLVDGKKFHIRTLTMLDREYGRIIHERYKNNDPGIQIIETKPKHLYTYSLETRKRK